MGDLHRKIISVLQLVHINMRGLRNIRIARLIRTETEIQRNSSSVDKNDQQN